MPPQKELATLVKHYILLYFLTKFSKQLVQKTQMPSWIQHSKEKCEGKSDRKSKQEGMKLPYVVVIFLKDHMFHKSITKLVKPDRQSRLCQRADELPEGKVQSPKWQGNHQL